MRSSIVFIATLLSLLVTRLANAGPPETSPSPITNVISLDALSASIRGALVHSLPTPLLESKQNWGHTKNVVNGVTWKGQGLRVHPEPQHKNKNDGIWKKITVFAVDPANTLVLDLKNLQQSAQGPVTFDAFLSFDAKAVYERQNWQTGVRLYGGSTRVRFRVKLFLRCEAATRLEKTDSFIPDLVFRMRVAHADLHYDNVVCEHTAGLGGEAAKLLGKLVQGSLHRFHPALERDMLAKANAAIVKAGDTKEVRLSLRKLLKL